MTKNLYILSSLALLAIGGFFFSSCTSTTAPNTTGGTQNVAVTAATANSITVSWTRDGSDSAPDTLLVMTTGGTSPAGSSPVATSSSSATVTGLTVNTEYTIMIGSAAGRTSAITFTTWAAPGANSLMVNSVSATSIGAMWTRGAGDNGVDTVVAMNGTTVAGTALVASGNTGAVTGLTEGTAYSISVRNATGQTNSMTWETAQRFTGIKIFEKKDPSSSDPSVLTLASKATQAISLSGATNTNADFVLDNISSGSGITLEAGDVYNLTWNTTLVANSVIVVPGGLANYYRSSDYTTDLISATSNAYDIPDNASTGSGILIVKTADAHLALVEIVPDASTGLLYSTNAAGYKYITVNVSYQSGTAAAAPYAARGRAHHSYSGPVARVSAK